MNSKTLYALLTGLILAGISRAGVAPETFVNESLGVLPAKQKILLQGEVQDAVRSVYGGRYPAFSIPYWEQDGARVWILKARGKHGYVQAGFVVRDGRLCSASVLSSKEQRGRFIETSRFLKQFDGAGLKESRKIDRRIDGVSGATLSVNAMKKIARLALVLDAFLAGESR